MSLQCRLSTGFDVFLIEELIQECFGDREQFGVLENIEKRYWLIFDGNKLVGMTGFVVNSKVFNGAEIDWTCLLPQYRGRGIITNTLKDIIKNYDGDIYCDCWKLQDSEKPALHCAMKQLGFTLLIEGYQKYAYPHTSVCKSCTNKIKDVCRCQTDLYIRHK